LGPHIRDVVSDRVESVNPDSHITYPSFNIRFFDKGEGDSNLLNGGVESSNILIDSEVGFDFFDKSIHLIPGSIKYTW
jgi:hypothetical protein